ncbi:MspA family porin [Gordonia sp. LSe1-13]|uniref:MspA family porin n=1 Tax=Gordonia sesuvii TaxID=3116777 RepID=A0ABU7M7P8_9ACTN|nr:MspA family porin [Gordonia sp. LSe1-13]
MSKFSKLGLRRTAAACAAAAVATVGLASMGAGSAAAAPLANGSKVITGIDGERVFTERTGESQYSVARVAYNGGIGRTALLSGTYKSTASEGVGGNLKVQILAGCQLDVNEIGGSAGGGISILPSVGLSLSGGVSLPLSPGEAAIVDVTDKDFESGSATIQLQDFEIEFPNCGGYASARTITKVIASQGYGIEDDGSTVDGEGTLLQSTLYGQPFFVS